MGSIASSACFSILLAIGFVVVIGITVVFVIMNPEMALMFGLLG